MTCKIGMTIAAVALLAGCAGSQVKSPPLDQPQRTTATAVPTNLLETAQTDTALARARIKPASLPALQGVRGDGQPASLPADFASPFKLVALVLKPEGVASLEAARAGVGRVVQQQPKLAAYQVVVLESGMEAFARFAKPMLHEAKLTTPYPFVFGMVTYAHTTALARALELSAPAPVQWVLLAEDNRVLWQSSTFTVADEAAVLNTVSGLARGESEAGLRQPMP